MEEVVRTRSITCIVVALGVVASTSTATAKPMVSSTYVRERASATWVVPTRTPGRVVVYAVSAVSYMDVETGATVKQAVVTRSRCTARRPGERVCGRPQIEASVIPESFDVADDLSSANLAAWLGERSVVAEWTPHSATDHPEAHEPRIAEYSESCPEGTGEGRGLHRQMRVTGHVLGRSFDTNFSDLTAYWVDRALIRTDCARPEGVGDMNT